MFESTCASSQSVCLLVNTHYDDLFLASLKLDGTLMSIIYVLLARIFGSLLDLFTFLAILSSSLLSL